MNDSIERTLVDWLREGPDRGPEHGLERALAATRRTSQRPGWTFPERWLPTQPTMRLAYVPRAAYLLLIAALLVAAIAAAALWIGSRRSVAPPFGLAANGSIVLNADGQLWVADADGTNARLLDYGLGSSYSPAFSPDGSRLAFHARPQEPWPMSLYVARADGTDPVRISGDMPIIAEEDSVISWSPDGSRVAFSSRDDGTRRLYVAAIDGSGVAPVSDGDAERWEPAWSPDGSWLAYTLSGATDRLEHLAVMRTDGTRERRLLSAPPQPTRLSFVGSTWSPDSSRLAYYRADGPDLVVGIVDLEGQEVVLSKPGEEATLPAWSPDGSRVSYIKWQGGAVVVDVETRARLMIPPGPADCAAIWAPDGTALLGFDATCSRAFRIPLDDPTSATPVAVPAGAFRGATWQRVAP
jgi:dipeptidyl aminopeptidase/acylaminoacyl peptidase